MENREIKPQELKEAVEKNGISVWLPFTCSICNVEHGFIFENGMPLRDSSCGCAWSNPHHTTWEYIAEIINRQTNEKVIEEFKEYFNL